MGTSINLALDLPSRGSRQLRRALHEQLRSAIQAGRLKPGTRLPSTREMAAAYGVSRNTAVAVFNQLSHEGYLHARRGAGMFVAETLPTAVHGGMAEPRAVPDARLAPFWRTPPAAPRNLLMPPVQFDFRLGVAETGRFPYDVWRRLHSRTVRAVSKTRPVFNGAQGKPVLRAAIAHHVSASRAVACDADSVLVTVGAQQAFDLLAKTLVTPGETVVALEDPGYPPMRTAFAAAGAVVQPVPVDEEGLVVERLPAGARVICVSPSHHFPLGVAMSLRRREQLLDHAQRHGAVIIEDDYDSEFRFGKQPLDALQTLDRHGSVLYVGTFSKSLFLGVRLGFLVLPPWARPALAAAKLFADWQCPPIEQLTLAAFMAEGHLGRHIRKMQALYAARRTALLAGLAAHFGGSLEVIPSSAGLHVSAFLKPALDLERMAQRAREHDIGIYTLREFYQGGAERPGLIFGYGAIDERRIAEGLNRLQRLWRH